MTFIRCQERTVCQWVINYLFFYGNMFKINGLLMKKFLCGK